MKEKREERKEEKKVELKKKKKKDSLVLPPIEVEAEESSSSIFKPSGTSDERFKSLFESLSTNLFTEQHGKHPLTH